MVIDPSGKPANIEEGAITLKPGEETHQFVVAPAVDVSQGQVNLQILNVVTEPVPTSVEQQGTKNAEKAEVSDQKYVDAELDALSAKYGIPIMWLDERHPFDWAKIRSNLSNIDKALGFVGGYQLKDNPLCVKRDKNEPNVKTFKNGKLAIRFDPLENDPNVLAKAILDALKEISEKKSPSTTAVNQEKAEVSDEKFVKAEISALRKKYDIRGITFWTNAKTPYDWVKIKENLSVIDRALGYVGGYQLKIYDLVMNDDRNDRSPYDTNSNNGKTRINIDPYEKDPHVIAKAILFALEEKRRLKAVKGDENAAIDWCTKDTRTAMRDVAVLNGCEGKLRFGYMAGGTEKGDNDRKNNQDSMFVDPVNEMIAVADGMGGHECGELASTLAINRLYGLATQRIPLNSMALPIGQYLQFIFGEWLKKNRPELYKTLAPHGYIYPEPGTTLSFLRIVVDSNGQIRIEGLLIGDSPVYIIDLKAGSIVSKPQLQHNPANPNVLENCVRPLQSGEQLKMQPEYVSVDVPRGGKYLALICSDGVTGVINDNEIVAIAMKHGENAWRELLDLAKKRKSSDNSTACQMIVNG